MRKNHVVALALACGMLIPASAKAQDAKLVASVTGIGTLGTRCVVSSDKKFVSSMCERLAASVGEQAASLGMKHIPAGITWDRPPEQAWADLVAASGDEAPLLIEFFVRGTDGNPAAASIHILASVIYEGAVEADGGGPARSGRLVVWEEAGTSSGPPNQLAAALAGFVAGKMQSLYDALRAARQ